MPQRDAGRLSAFLAVALSGLFFIIAVAVDAAGVQRTTARAENLAAEAARAAGQGIDLEHAAQHGEHVVDQGRAVAFAHQYLATAYATTSDQPYGSPDVFLTDDETAVVVTVTLTYEPSFLSLLGWPDIPATGTATAILVTG